MGGGLPTLDTMGEQRGEPSPNANIYWIDYDQLVAVKAYLTITNQHRIGIKYLFRLGKKELQLQKVPSTMFCVIMFPLFR